MAAKPREVSNRKVSPPVLAPHNLPFQMHLLVQQMTRRWQQLLDPHGLTPLHWGVLCCLWERESLPTTEIAAQLEQLNGTITVALDTMEKRGLIRRNQDEQDRRVLRISLTHRARQMRAELVPAAAGLIESLFSSLTESEYIEFARTLTKLRSAITQQQEVNLG